MTRQVKNIPSGPKKGKKDKRDIMPLTEFKDPLAVSHTSGIKKPKGEFLIESITEIRDLPKEIITTTPDILQRHLDQHDKILSQKRGWIVPLTSATMCLLPLVTSEFHHAMGLSGATWQAIFFIGFILSIGWLSWSIFFASKALSHKKSIIEDIKSESNLTISKGLWIVH